MVQQVSSWIWKQSWKVLKSPSQMFRIVVMYCTSPEKSILEGLKLIWKNIKHVWKSTKVPETLLQEPWRDHNIYASPKEILLALAKQFARERIDVYYMTYLKTTITFRRRLRLQFTRLFTRLPTPCSRKGRRQAKFSERQTSALEEDS